MVLSRTDLINALSKSISKNEIDKLILNSDITKHSIYKNRESKLQNKILLNKENVWEAVLVGMLTSQQKSGNGSIVDNFIKNGNLSYKNVHGKDFKEAYKNTGLRFSENKLPDFTKHNWDWLNSEDFNQFIEFAVKINDSDSERKLANHLKEKLKGIGNKQSRNILQYLGITKYKIPIDSRFINWLEEIKFPIPLSQIALQDVKFYEFMNDVIIQACKNYDERFYLAFLDAAVFVKQELKNEKNEKN